MLFFVRHAESANNARLDHDDGAGAEAEKSREAQLAVDLVAQLVEKKPVSE